MKEHLQKDVFFLKRDLKEDKELASLITSGREFQRVGALTEKPGHPWSSALTAEQLAEPWLRTSGRDWAHKVSEDLRYTQVQVRSWPSTLSS